LGRPLNHWKNFHFKTSLATLLLKRNNSSVLYAMPIKTSPDQVRIPQEQLRSEFNRILIDHAFSPEKAAACASIFVTNALEGIYTHSVNRFPKFIQFVRKGYVKPDREAICKHRAGSIEQWDGQLGVGVLNATQCTDRAVALASEFGMGCVALANTNHWMRGGAYGWQAAKKGYLFIGWTNTNSNMPAWGAVDSRLGNNPLIIAVPFENEAIVLDMAMSQYSYGALEFSKLKGEKLPVPGGYDANGNVSDDPGAIIDSRRTMPVGYWKGAGLSLLLDILATILSGGLSTAEISKQEAEYKISQVYIAIKLSGLQHYSSIVSLIRQIIDDYHQSEPLKGVAKVRYPGEQVLRIRAENAEHGIPVLKKVWEEILAL
jgi:3-dehydro-L-gulonate 2-dehydrogenase